MQINKQQLMQAMPGVKSNLADTLLPLFAKYFPIYGITTPARLHAFLAQVGHESNQFTRVRESLYYTSAERIRAVWPSRFPTLASAAPFVKNEYALAEKVYNGRLGNNQPGDGYKFRGGGYLQNTGKDAYRRVSLAIFGDERMVKNPDLIQQPEVALVSALHFWKTNNCNAFADAGDIKGLTKRINGGYTGLADRTNLWNNIKRVLQGNAAVVAGGTGLVLGFFLPF